jgi:hypothetical protein
MIFTDADLTVNLEAPSSEKRAWNSRIRPPANNTYVGQLKLLATEIAFLNTIDDLNNCVVVYAGAAAGQHIPALALLFPKLHFYLYDPAPFAIQETEYLHIINGFFTDEIAQEWSESRTIFICDIRTSGDTSEEHESEVQANMAMQAHWVEILKPNLVAYSLKFRIPFTIVEADLPYLYLGGRLIYQPFAKPLSMELRLIGTKEDLKPREYDSRSLEQIVFYHNTVVRPDLGRYRAEAEFNGGYDCAYLLYTIRRRIGQSPVKMARKMIEITSQGRWKLSDRQRRH